MIVLALTALLMTSQAAPDDADIYWTPYIYPETLEGEARARAKSADVVRREGNDLHILHPNQPDTVLSSDTKCELPEQPCNIWLYQGTIRLGSERLVVARLENGHGGRDAIVRGDGTLFWTDGPPWSSPDGRWIAASADWFDEMDDSKQNNALRVFDWSGQEQPVIFPASCRVTEWNEQDHFKVLCDNDAEGVVSRTRDGQWQLRYPEGGKPFVVTIRAGH